MDLKKKSQKIINNFVNIQFIELLKTLLKKSIEKKYIMRSTVVEINTISNLKYIASSVTKGKSVVIPLMHDSKVSKNIKIYSFG